MGQCGDEDLSSILFGSIPKHADLFYLMGTISLSENNAASISNKAYQSQIFKCRCLIFTVSEVIASPVLGAVQNIHIIISKKFKQSGKLGPHLEKLNIKVSEPQPLTNAVYEACLRYTILARLAPSWNQVEKYLVQGRDFLLSPSPMDAVKLDIVINDEDMHIALWPLRVRLPQVSTQDLQSSSFSSPFSWDLSCNNMTVHVLPSLNKANVLMVSGHIPQNSLFKSYKDFKRHWKNSYGYRLPESDEGMVYVTVKFGRWFSGVVAMTQGFCLSQYGYRLPESDEGMVYVTVKFGRWFSESLTYPIICVRARRPVFLRQLEPQRVLLAILGDLHAKVPTICGHPFGIEAKVRYALPKLNVLSQVLYPCNLTEIKPEFNRGKDEEKEVSQYSQPVSQYTQSQYSRAATAADNKRSISPPPFLPRLSQLITPVPTPAKPVFVPVFTPKPRPAPAASPPPGPSDGDRPPTSTATVRPMFGGVPMKPVFGLAQSSPTFHSDKLLSSSLKRKSLSPYPLFGSPKPLFSVRGEKSLLHFPETSCKKSRNKPQIQTGVDVKTLAQTRGGLDRVNTTTLIAYLRGEGIPCKVKDKKGVLVNKVLAHLKLPLQESPPHAGVRPRGSTLSVCTPSDDSMTEDLIEM